MSRTGWIILIVCLCLVLCICAGLFLAGRVTNALFSGRESSDHSSVIQKYKDLKNPYSADGTYSVKADDLKELDIDWISGSVKVELTDGDVIRFQETADRAISEKDALRYGVSGGKLRIQACKKNHVGKLPRKDLVLSLPRTLADRLQELEIDTVSASISAADLQVKELELNTVSGKVEASNMIAEEAEIDSVSGRINVSGSARKVKVSSVSGPIECNMDECRDIRANTVSGQVTFVLRSTPKELKVYTTSGEVRLALPTEASCAIELDAMSGKLFLNDTAVGAKQLTLGDGDALFDIDTMSGNVYVYTK